MQLQSAVQTAYSRFPHLPTDIELDSSISMRLGFLLPVFLSAQAKDHIHFDPTNEDQTYDLLWAARMAAENFPDREHCQFAYGIRLPSGRTVLKALRLSFCPMGNYLISFPWEI